MQDRPEIPSDFAALLLGSFLLSFAVAISHGTYLEGALVCIAVALAVLAWRFVIGLRGRAPSPVQRPKLVCGLLLLALVVMQITAMCDPKLIVYPHGSIGLIRGVEWASVLLLATYVPFLGGAEREPWLLRRGRFVAFGALTLLAGMATIRISPAPVIDVWDIQMRGAAALLHGENPYATVTDQVTCLEYVAHGVTRNPYVYAPGALYVGVLALLLGGDVRYAMLLAILIAGVAVRAIARAPEPRVGSRLPALIEDAPSLFIWLMPSLFFVLELSWTDPVQLGLVAVAVAAYTSRRPMFAAVAIGVALATKQSMFWLIPLAGFVLRFRVYPWIAMLATSGVLYGPFVLWDFHAFKYATVDFLVGLPPRSDALSAAVWLARTVGWTLPGSVASGIVAAVVVAAIVGARASVAADVEATAVLASSFARAAAVAYLAFFFFNKLAFANYYFFVAGVAAVAGAASLRAWRSSAGSQPTTSARPGRTPHGVASRSVPPATARS